MVSVHEAEGIILKAPFKPSLEWVSLENAIGRVLAQPLNADRDFPPFDRVSMDGIALDYAQVKSGQVSFPIRGTQAAGSPQLTLTDPHTCLEVMTGAMLPQGTDTVVSVEELSVQDGVATLQNKHVQSRQNIHPRAQDAREGQELLSPGILLSPAEIALLASVGASKVGVKKLPKTAVISTGDELVDVDQKPLPHQIRRSNTYALLAAMKEMGWTGEAHHLIDHEQTVLKKLRAILDENDVVILSGGVSKGKFDYIPSALKQLGVTQLFHQISQRPGKPFWFGTSPEGKTVFAFPGNPVSTYLCFYRYLKPWLRASMGMETKPQSALLKTAFSFAPKLTYFLQVKTSMENGKQWAEPIPGGGSGDFANLKDVDGFLELPLERNTFEAGEAFPYIPFRH